MEETGPADTLTLAIQPLELRDRTFLLLNARSLGPCYGSLNKVIHAPSGPGHVLGRPKGGRQPPVQKRGSPFSAGVPLPSQPKGDFALHLRTLNNTQLKSVPNSPLCIFFEVSSELSPT